MKFCTDHWSACHDAIVSRGLSHLVAKDGATAIENIKAELDGQFDTKTNYDPLMSLSMMLYGRALEMGGMYLMFDGPNGTPYCPLCEANQHMPDNHPSGMKPDNVLINGASDAILLYCREQGLVPNPS